MIGEFTGCLSQRRNRTYAEIRCPLYTDSFLKEKCEGGRGQFTRDEPVTELITGLVYRNSHCARCHGVKVFTPWTLHIFCLSFQDLYQMTSEQDILHRLKDAELGENDVCDLVHLPPPGSSPTKCPSFYPYSTPQHPDPVIRTCNITGLWKTFNSRIYNQCTNTSPLLSLVVREYPKPRRTFANLFCAMCNGIQPVVQTYVSQPFVLDKTKRVPLTFLLGLDSREEEEADSRNRCLPGQWLSWDNICRNLSCAAGKILNVANTTCTTAVRMIRGLVYHVDFLLVPLDKITVQQADMQDALRNLTKATNAKFTNKIRNSVAQFFTTYEVQYRSESDFWIDIVSIHVFGNITASYRRKRDMVEESIVKNLLQENWDIFYCDQFIKFALTLSSLDDTLLCEEDVHFYVQSYSEKFELKEVELAGPGYVPKSRRLLLNELLSCPFIELNSSEFTSEYTQWDFATSSDTDQNNTELHSQFSHKWQHCNTSGHESEFSKSKVTPRGEHLSIVLMETKILLKDLHFSWIIRPNKNSSLLVCVKKLEELYARSGPNAPHWQYLLSMTAIPLSILCLFLILLVYILLPALRTQPGLNTMGTSFTLLLAQFCLLLSSHRLLQGAWCTALGVLVHVFWLSTFCWTTVCSVHMFRAFSSKVECSYGPGSYKVLLANTAVTLLLPGMIVAVVMIVSWHTSGGESLGYSSSSCYLQSSLLVGLALVLPLAIIVTVNIVMYMVTVYHIYTVYRLQTSVSKETDNGFQHVTACLRLSLLTGSSWFLSILAEGLDVDWLRALSIVANGGQGTMLLLSYFTTRRVVAMLAVRLGVRSDVTARSDSQFSTRVEYRTSEVMGKAEPSASDTAY
ncbi:hypothetical protein ACOMHN_049344 [Nucella lapillus]